MPDTDILYFLSLPVTILGTQYKVAWDCEQNCAKVLFLRPDSEEWETVDKSFSRELDAHEYLNNLASLQPPPQHDWRDLCQNE